MSIILYFSFACRGSGAGRGRIFFFYLVAECRWDQRTLRLGSELEVIGRGRHIEEVFVSLQDIFKVIFIFMQGPGLGYPRT
jgi:hypothetical protein